MTLATQTDLERFLQVDFTSPTDPVVAQLLAQAESDIAQFCGRPHGLQEASITQTFDPQGLELISLTHEPVWSITTVTEKGVALTEDQDYIWMQDGRLKRRSGGTIGEPWTGLPWLWPVAPRSVTVAWVAGWDPNTAGHEPPDALVGLACQVAGRRFKTAARYAAQDTAAGEVQSVQLQGVGTITYRATSPLVLQAGTAGSEGGDSAGLTKGEQQTASQWRLVQFAGGSV